MDQKEFIKALPEMKYSSYETLKDPKRQIILILLFDTSHKKKMTAIWEAAHRT